MQKYIANAQCAQKSNESETTTKMQQILNDLKENE